jgi:hypothetical protein
VRAREHLARLRPQVIEIARRNGASKLRLFGSAARGEDGPKSDIDFLVEFEPGRTLLDLVGLEQELTDLLGRKVDVVVEGGVSRHLEPRILSEAVAI